MKEFKDEKISIDVRIWGDMVEKLSNIAKKESLRSGEKLTWKDVFKDAYEDSILECYVYDLITDYLIESVDEDNFYEEE